MSQRESVHAIIEGSITEGPDLIWLKDSALPVRDAFLAEVQQMGKRWIRPKSG
jgi:hypothetical protein